MVAYIPGEIIASGFGVLLAATIWLGRGLSNIRERIARLEEWIRLHDSRDT